MQDFSQDLPPGPEPRWFIYVAAIICGGFFSGLVVEGLSFGPRLPDGRRSLLAISDNNFSTLQFTQVLAFSLE